MLPFFELNFPQMNLDAWFVLKNLTRLHTWPLEIERTVSRVLRGMAEVYFNPVMWCSCCCCYPCFLQKLDVRTPNVRLEGGPPHTIHKAIHTTDASIIPVSLGQADANWCCWRVYNMWLISRQRVVPRELAKVQWFCVFFSKDLPNKLDRHVETEDF